MENFSCHSEGGGKSETSPATQPVAGLFEATTSTSSVLSSEGISLQK